MYTQCPKCQTVFKLSAGVLRQAGGQVRCGRCGEIFNALARLTEDANSLLEDDPSVDLEARADSILESAASLSVAEAVAKDYDDYLPPGTEVAHLKVLDYWASEDERDGDDGQRRRRDDFEFNGEPRHLQDEASDDPASGTDAGPEPDGEPALGGAAANPTPEDPPLVVSTDASDIDDLLASLEEESGDAASAAGPEGEFAHASPLVPEPPQGPEPPLTPEAPLTGPDETRDAPDAAGRLAEGLVDSAATPSGPVNDDPTAQTDNVEALDEASLEFTLPPGELDRIFVESQPWVFRLPADAQADEDEALPPDALQSAPITAEEITSESEAFDPDRPIDILLPDALFEVPDADAASDAEPGAAVAASPPEPPTLGTSAIRHLDVSEYERSHPDETREPLPHPESVALADRRSSRRAALEPFEAARRELGALSEPLSPELDELGPAGPRTAPTRGRVLGWCAAALLLALALAAQLVRHEPDWLAEHAQGPLGPLLRSVSGAMGTSLGQPPTLSAYQVRQWGASGEPGAAGILRLRASILNAAAQLQPYPLLRVTLADRFGKRIGARDFLPAEYLGKPVARMLAPGERADAVLDIVDPGKNAEDFEIDVCLRSGSRTRCANDAATQGRP